VISSHWTYYYWSERFASEILGTYLQNAISFSKDSLLVQFAGKNAQKVYEFKFIDGELVITEGNEIKNTSKVKQNAIVQFKELVNQSVVNIEWALFDRQITIEFSNQYKLLIKGFGRYSNILLYSPSQDLPDSIFRLNLKNDWEFKLQNYTSFVFGNSIRELRDYNLCYNVQDFKIRFKSLNINEIDIFFDLGFFEGDLKSQSTILSNIDFFQLGELTSSNGNLQLSKGSSSFQQWGKFLDDFFKAHSKKYFFTRKKLDITGRLEKEIKLHRAQIKNLEARISEISTRRSFRELGDLLLTNAHSIKRGTSEALVSDYYTGHRIRVKLNPDLSAAENAEKYYRKAKNESMELSKFTENLNYNVLELSSKEKALIMVGSAENSKDLSSVEASLRNHPQKEIKTKVFPYKLYEFQGFEVWVGKNAKSNDELLRLSKKNDLWLHAMGVFGSHVIIRKKLREYPKEAIRYAAELAAFHSKGKHQGLQTVMIAERKYVSKQKGAAAGMVNVLQFQTIDVEPRNHG
jgi:predicted ribosome quality control (RQC) complex YloA/Tae2 family protein